MVALVFGALASRMPLAGYTYQWMSRLANPHIGWLVGWFMFAFLIVDVVAVDYAVASAVAPVLFGYVGTTANTWVVTGVVILVQCLLIMFSTLWAERVNNVAVGTELVGIGGLTILIFIVGAVGSKLEWGHLFSKGVAAGASPYLGLGTLTHVTPWILAFLLGSFTIVGFEACGTSPRRPTSRSVSCPVRCGRPYCSPASWASCSCLPITATWHNLRRRNIVDDVLGSVVGKAFLGRVPTPLRPWSGHLHHRQRCRLADVARRWSRLEGAAPASPIAPR